MATSAARIDLDKFRLRRFVERLVDIGEMEVREEPVPRTRVSEIIERTRKGVLFRQAGPEKLELAAKVAGGRARIAAAFDTTLDRLHDVYQQRLVTPQEIVEIPSGDAPVHEIVLTGDDVDLTKLPFHPQHELDGSCYISAAIDYTVDPQTGRTNVGSRRLSLRNRKETGTNVTAPSAHLPGARRPRRAAADHVHRRRPSAGPLRRHFPDSWRRARPRRALSRRARGGGEEPHQRASS